MADRDSPTTGQIITTFTFILFGLLLGLAALAEPVPVKSALLGFCAVLSLMGAARYQIQKLAETMRRRRG